MPTAAVGNDGPREGSKGLEAMETGGTTSSAPDKGSDAGGAAAGSQAAAQAAAQGTQLVWGRLPRRHNPAGSRGRGFVAEVWRASYCSTIVAVKLLGTDKAARSSLTGSVQQQHLLRKLRAEAANMSRLRHPNVCQYLGACEQPPCLVMEWCSRKSLDGVLAGGLRDAAAARELTWPRLLGIALGAAKGMLYLHTRSPPVLHRDLKSANLLLDSNWCVKVCDFNMSKAMDADATASTLMLRNPRWLAPEVLDGGTGNRPADVWAFGTVLWELATWRLPYAEQNAFQIISQVQRAGAACLPPLRPDALPAGPLGDFEGYAALMQACLSPRPEGRPSLKTVVQRLSALLDSETATPEGPEHTRSVRVLRIPGPGPAAAAAAAALQQRRQSMGSAPSTQTSAPSSVAGSSAPSRANSAAVPSSPFAARSGGGAGDSPAGASPQQQGGSSTV
ncbi:Serine threonine-kinase CTR1 [Micractinium conductrix]|uniref:Serine threonine-kinase CTR1 n=1 Tax=Micractinium conductrix TaxID=554055 RepID=A0A2P6VJC7_9CHLO|nr:Serine threonine-kinase CTR1 [Micractinium conductrix]|eukprot:PSC74167.1 Serine threonine-kinase CTR1 [Micractinium conductrix]